MKLANILDTDRKYKSLLHRVNHLATTVQDLHNEMRDAFIQKYGSREWRDYNQGFFIGGGIGSSTNRKVTFAPQVHVTYRLWPEWSKFRVIQKEIDKLSQATKARRKYAGDD